MRASINTVGIPKDYCNEVISDKLSTKRLIPLEFHVIFLFISTHVALVVIPCLFLRIIRKKKPSLPINRYLAHVRLYISQRALNHNKLLKFAIPLFFHFCFTLANRLFIDCLIANMLKES